MPLLALIIGVQTATPLVAFVMLTTTIVILWNNRQNIDFHAAGRLFASSLVGIPLGIFLVKEAPEAIVQGILGALLILFSLYALRQPQLPTLHHQGWAYIFGLIAGVLGGAYNTNGPPLVLYGVLRRWSPDRFRATLQGYFVPANILIWLGHGLTGLWTERVIRAYALALPLILLAIWLGSKLHSRIPAERFSRLLYMLLIGLGFLLLL